MVGYSYDVASGTLVPDPLKRLPSAGRARTTVTVRSRRADIRRLAKAHGLRGAAADSWTEKRASKFERDEYVPVTKKAREIRGIKRMDNGENPCALGAKVFEWDKRELSDWEPNAAKRKMVDVLAAAYLTGALQLSDFPAKTQRQIIRASQS